MTEETKKEIVKTALENLEAFYDFAIEKGHGKMTVRDFDVWLGGYMSGVATVLSKTVASELELMQTILEMGEVIACSELAKKIGVTGTLHSSVTFANLAK